jgi:hypothetical protein
MHVDYHSGEQSIWNYETAGYRQLYAVRIGFA